MIEANELVQSARDMVPVMRERAARCEELRRLPEETERDFRDAGFYRILQPERYGGFELEYGIQTRLAAEIGRGCASSAWNLSVIAAHGWMLGMFPPAAQEEIWGQDSAATIATSFLPKGGKVHRQGDGLRVEGRWGFSSGVDYCVAAMLMVSIPPATEGDAPELAFALVPNSDYRIEDAWFTTGLAGTGSNDIVIESAEVPAHRILPVTETRGGPTPGSAVNPGYLYQVPLFATFPFNLVGAALGASKGALEILLDGMAERNSVAHVRLAEQQSVQLRIAEAAAEIHAARTITDRHADHINALGRDFEAPDIMSRATWRRDLGYSVMLCSRAMERIFPLLGGRGLATGDPVQRAWRDVHAVAQHIALVWDVQAALYGAIAAGLPCPDPKL